MTIARSPGIECTHRLQCSCGTWDSLHESGCELNSAICENCAEKMLDEIPWPTEDQEPDPWRDQVKDMTDDEIDAGLALLESPTQHLIEQIRGRLVEIEQRLSLAHLVLAVDVSGSMMGYRGPIDTHRLITAVAADVARIDPRYDLAAVGLELNLVPHSGIDTVISPAHPTGSSPRALAGFIATQRPHAVVVLGDSAVAPADIQHLRDTAIHAATELILVDIDTREIQ